MTKKTARYGGSPAPYTKHRKRRYTYDQVPLHNSNEGLSVTETTVRRFAQRHGIEWPVPKHRAPN